MKHFLITLFILPYFCSAQVGTIYTEDFGTNCNPTILAVEYDTPIGNWSQTETGSNGSQSSVWYVSAKTNGNDPGECGSNCGGDATLHLSYSSWDEGYYYGTHATYKRIESPIIDCSDFLNVELEFDYLRTNMVGATTSLWYDDGTSWHFLADLPVTTGSCSNNQNWNHYSISLPNAVAGNPLFRLGFDMNLSGNASTSSYGRFAIDDIVLSGSLEILDLVPPLVECPDTIIVSCHEVPLLSDLIAFEDLIDNYPSSYQSVPTGTFLEDDVLANFTVMDFSGNETVCQVLLDNLDIVPPVITCPADTTLL